MTVDEPLPAKVAIPNVDAYVERSRAFRILDSQKNTKITWISAPGGAGKTILVSSYLASQNGTTLWYQVDLRDSDPANLFHYLTVASKLNDLPRFSPEYASVLPLFTANFFETLFARVKKPFFIVFDNLQDAPEGSGIIPAIIIAANQLPRGGRIFCISRENPPADLSVLRAKQELHLLGEESLRFAVDEIKALAKMSGIDTITEQNAEGLYQRTMGWAAGIVLLLNEPSMTEFSNDNMLTNESVIYDYFNSEFYEHWSDELRWFLATTALLPRMTVSSAREISGNPHANEVIGGLLKKNYFIVRYRFGGFQYHPLFRQFLLYKSKEVIAGDKFNELQYAAAEIALSMGYVSETMEIYARASDWDKLAVTFFAYVESTANEGKLVTIESWLELFPEAVRDSEPWLGYWCGVCRLMSDPEAALKIAKNSFKLFCMSSDALGAALSWSLVLDALLVTWDDFSDVDALFESYAQNVGNDFKFPSPVVEARVLSSALGVSVFKGVEHNTLKKWLMRAMDVLNDVDDINVRVPLAGKIILCSAMVVGGQEESDRIWRSVEREIVGATPLLPYNRLWWIGMLSTYLMMRGDYESFVALLSSSFKIANETGVHLFDQMYTGLMVMGHLIYGEVDLALEWQGKHEILTHYGDALTTSYMHAMKGWCYLETGDLPAAVGELNLSISVAQKGGFDMHAMFFSMLLVNCYIEAGQYALAEERINDVKNYNRRFDCRALPFVLECVYARLAWRQGNVNDVDKHLAAALGQVVLNKEFLPLYGWRSSVMSELCGYALINGINSEEAKFLISKYRLKVPSSLPKIQSWPWLCRIATLGGFDVEIGGERVPDAKLRAKPWNILKAVIAMGGEDVPVDAICDLLWPDAEGDAASSSFSTNLQRLRKLFGNDDIIVVQNRHVSLNNSLVWTDLDLFQSTDFSDKYRLDVYNGDFFHGDKAVWLEPKRTSLRKVYEALLSKDGL